MRPTDRQKAIILPLSRSKANGCLFSGAMRIHSLKPEAGTKAAALLEGLAIGAGRGDGLGAGVDRGDAFDVLDVLGEERNQAPTQRDEFALAAVAVVADDRLDGGGGDVVVPRRRRGSVVDQMSMEGFGDLLLVTPSIVPTAHK